MRIAVHAEACLAGGFVGTYFGIHQDLTGHLPKEWRAFNKEFIPVYLEKRPYKSKVAAGLGQYRVGEICGSYTYAPGEMLPHRRPVRWLDQTISRADMSEELAEPDQTVRGVVIALEEDQRLRKALAMVPAIEFYR